ncbi:UBX domain-containing protein 1 [Nilaparvata lugens]|uniref:UBX domain-containing protein 1 n=1 Tax=Nilaparvata lugens TaxID=108931 RepID=UPI000B9951F4|nr:UBX domain-containing protein 1 [Nilaparvata lugens]
MSSSGDVQMLIEMGFTKDKAEKALSVTGNQGVEPAMEWLLAHGDEISANNTTESGDQSSSNAQLGNTSSAPEIESAAEQVAKSLKCNECGKLFSTQLEVEFHATKSGHSDFSESTEEKKPLTEEEKVEQLKKLEEKMRQKRKEREEQEKQEAIERERNRIRSGKEMAAAKKKLEDEEIKKIVEQRRREKEEDRLAKERVRQQIEQDKLERRKKFEGATAETKAPAAAAVPAASPVSPQPSKDYTQTRLQIRLTNGSALTQTFGSKEQLSAVRLFIDLNRKDGSREFSLMTNFPKKVFTEDDYDKPLDALGLVPSAVLILTNK